MNPVAAPPAFPAEMPASMMGLSAMDSYFTEERLHQALGTSELLRPRDVQVVAYNFPSWHASPFMEAHFGQGWTEWDVVRKARPYFPGHTMPHFPLWGYYDESDPVWAAREIDLAADYGVDAWMIDWYWHSGTQFYHEQLERGFLKAENRNRLKFAIMWANHDWKNVYPARSPREAPMLIPQVHTLSDFADVLNYCAEHYFSQPNYLTLDGAPIFAFFDANIMVRQLGEDGLKRGLALMRERAEKLGFPRLHLQASECYDLVQDRLRALGFDSATQYGSISLTYRSRTPGQRLPYGTCAVETVASWREKKAQVKVPFFPSLSTGWDDSPRFEEFGSVAINRSPDQFERLVRAARHFVADDLAKLIYICAWNEWTEDQRLLPDTYWGYSYLEALRRAVRE